MVKLSIFIYFCFGFSLSINSVDLKCRHVKDKTDTQSKNLEVLFKGEKYSTQVNNRSKLVSCEIKKIKENKFLFYTFKKRFTVLDKTHTTHMLHVFVFDKNRLKLTYEHILKSWSHAEKEPHKNDFQINLKEIDGLIALEVVNIKDPSDIVLYYFYDEKDQRFMRKRKFKRN